MAENTSFQGPPQWYQDYAQGYLRNASQLAGRPYQPYMGQRVANMSPTSQIGIGGLRGMAQDSPLQPTMGYLSGVMQGGTVNPFLDQVAGRTARDVNNNYYAATANNLRRFSGPNRLSSAFQGAQDRTDESLARGLGDALAPVYSQGFENTQNRQMQAAGMMPGLMNAQSNVYQNAINAGGLESAYQQRLLDSRYGDYMDWRNYPQQQLDAFGNALRSSAGSGGTMTSVPDPNRASQWAGGLLGLAGLGRGFGLW